MSYVSNEKQYGVLIHRLLVSQIDGESFCREFCHLWQADRDEESAKRDAWPKRYDLQLIDTYRRGEISSDEFERKWIELFGYGDYKHLVEMLAKIFTACDVFEPVPKREYEINEAQLKSEVGAHLATYETAKAKRHL